MNYFTPTLSFYKAKKDIHMTKLYDFFFYEIKFITYLCPPTKGEGDILFLVQILLVLALASATV